MENKGMTQVEALQFAIDNIENEDVKKALAAILKSKSTVLSEKDLKKRQAIDEKVYNYYVENPNKWVSACADVIGINHQAVTASIKRNAEMYTFKFNDDGRKLYSVKPTEPVEEVEEE